MLARENFDGPYVWDKPGLSGYLVWLVHLVSLLQPNKPDRPNRPNEQDRLADFFSILQGACPTLPFVTRRKRCGQMRGRRSGKTGGVFAGIH
jgi:hypothetical protein